MNPGENVAEAVAGIWYEAHDARLPLHLPGADEARRARRELVAQIDDYIMPRLRRPEAPLLAAVAGSTGSGRSTLVNSLVGREVSPSGVLRPTTRVPVLVCRASERHWFAGARVLPGLRRVAGGPRAADEGPSLVLHVDDRVPAGLGVLDVPDIDSVGSDHDLAARLLGAADVWLLVTTAARYADTVPWHLLRVARERTTEIGIVVNRVGVGEHDEVLGHFADLLDSAGMGRVPVFALPETPLVRHMLSRANITPVRNWLYERATRPTARETAVHRTLGGALRSLPARAEVVARAAAGQHAAAATLARCVERVYAAAQRLVDSALREGAPLSGGTLARWRSWHAAGLPESTAPAMERAVGDAVTGLLCDAAERAAGITERCWRGRPGGAELIARMGGGGRGGVGGPRPGSYGTVGSSAALGSTAYPAASAFPGLVGSSPAPLSPQRRDAAGPPDGGRAWHAAGLRDEAGSRDAPGARNASGPRDMLGPATAADRGSVEAFPTPLTVADPVAGGDGPEEFSALVPAAPSGAAATVGGSPAVAAAETVAAWLGETAARIPDNASTTRSTTAVVLVAALGPTAGDEVPRPHAPAVAAAGEAARQADAALTPELAAHVAPVRAALRERAAAFLDAERETRLRAVGVLRTNPGSGAYETGDAEPGAG